MVNDFNKEKIFWTKSMNIDLARFMADKPYIWDVLDPRFTNSNLRDKTFAKFAAKYNNEFGWMAVKERWTNIRSTYGFYMRKLMAKKSKGEDYRVNWFLWQPCKYLYKVYKSKSKPKRLHKATKKKRCPSENNHLSSSKEGSIELQDEPEDTNPTVTCDDIVENIITVFKGAQNNVFVSDHSEYSAIGSAITKKLTELNSFEAAKLSEKILGILTKYDENNPENPNNQL